MSGMEKISDAIMEKVKGEAQEIIQDAQNRANATVERAKAQRNERVDAEKARLLSVATTQASRILAQASIKTRQEILVEKTTVIDGIISKVKESLKTLPDKEKVLLSLTKESIAYMGQGKVVAYTAANDVAALKKIVNEDRELSDVVTDVREYPCIGGVVVEDAEGKSRIDNTFETRLEMLLPKILPEIGKELF